AEKGTPPCAARGAGHSLSHARGAGHRPRQGARRRESRPAPARDRVPHFRFRIARRSRRDPRGIAPRHAPDQSPSRSGRRSHRGSAREGIAGSGCACAGGCGNRGSHPTGYGKRDSPQAVQRGIRQAQSAAGERLSRRGRRYLAAPDRRSVHSRAAKILQDPRAQAAMSDRVRRRRAAWTAAPAAVLSAALSGVLSAVLSVATTATAVAQAVEDIRDIRGPKFTLPPWLLPAVIAGAVLLAFGGFRLWRRLRRRRQPRVLLPFEVALPRPG